LDAEVRSVTELAAIAREKVKQWRIRANDYGLSRHYEQAATDIARSFEIMLHHLDELSGNE
jgi:hypothetical protein